MDALLLKFEHRARGWREVRLILDARRMTVLAFSAKLLSFSDTWLAQAHRAREDAHA
jgi:hypothetical protein